MTIDTAELRLGDVLRLRKSHPCGSAEWEIVRLGADVGLRCRGCGRRVMLERPVLQRRAVAVVTRGAGPTADEILDLAERGR